MQMQRLKFIKNMNVQIARYELDDAAGHKVILVVDYAHNRYTVEASRSDLTDVGEASGLADGSNAPDNFLEEVVRLAAGLLARKHKVNLAQREQYL